jgi:FtsZ-binding cell division protein ZapB
MAPRSRVNQSVVEEGASGSEDDLATVGTQNRRKNTTAASKAKKTATMPRGGNSTATKRKAAPKTQNRQALADKTNIQPASDNEDIDNDDDMAAEKPKAKRAKTTATKNSRSTSAPARQKPNASRKPAAEALAVIPETQPDPEDVSQSIEAEPDQMDINTVPTPPRAQPFFQRARSTSVQPLQPRASARSASVQPVYASHRERSGSVSDATRERRGGDPELRRKLNDMTKKYENLNMKYQSLQQVGQSEEETNFEKLKRASDEKAKSANELIANLKKEIAELRKSNTKDTTETTGLQKQVTTLTTSNESLSTEVANLKTSLQLAQNEVKASEAKLIAARQQLSQSAQEKPANAPTTRNDLNRSIGPNASEAQKEAKMKENLYSDLTGLIICGVKTLEGEDQYDCIQTGRNGSKLPHYGNNCILTNHFPKPYTSISPSPRTPASRTRRPRPGSRTRRQSSRMSHCWMRTAIVSWLTCYRTT